MTERKAVADEKYRMAQERVADGTWRVDPESGLVHSRAGAALGYTTYQGYTALALFDKVQQRKRHLFAHRVVWEAVHGPIPDDLVRFQINHLNSVRNDNRLANLELVTASENCKHAHTVGLADNPRGEDAPWSRLTAAQVAELRRRYKGGEAQASLADAFGLTRGYVSLVVTGKRWVESFDGEPLPSRLERAAITWPTPEHGTFARYRGGTGRRWQPCRCDACRAANTERARQVRARQRERQGA